MTRKELDRLGAWMRARGFTQKKLAAATGWSQTSVAYFLRGLTPPSGTSGQSRQVDPRVWRRFKLTCAAVDRRLRGLPEFDWEVT